MNCIYLKLTDIELKVIKKIELITGARYIIEDNLIMVDDLNNLARDLLIKYENLEDEYKKYYEIKEEKGNE